LQNTLGFFLKKVSTKVYFLNHLSTHTRTLATTEVFYFSKSLCLWSPLAAVKIWNSSKSVESGDKYICAENGGFDNIGLQAFT